MKADIDAGRANANSQRTIFHEILTPNPKEGYVPPTPDEIKFEAYGILAAAADTTGNGLTTGAYYVINNPEIYKKLTTELKAAFPNPKVKLELSVLERLPYLVGILSQL